MRTNLLPKYSREFIQGFSLYYPVSEELLLKYEEIWDWKLLSRNRSIAWTLDLLKAFETHWWWIELASQSRIVNDRALFAWCFSHWDFTTQRLIFGYHHSNKIAKLEESTKKWIAAFIAGQPHVNWQALSAYEDFPWTADFINKNSDKLDWEKLSSNPGLPWSKHLIDSYKDRWSWKYVSSNKAIFGIEGIIASYVNNWEWKRLCGNDSIFWTLNQLEEFEEFIDWESLSVNESVNWTAEILYRFKNQLHWINIIGEEEFQHYLFNHPSILWTPELYAACNEAIKNNFIRVEARINALRAEKSKLDGETDVVEVFTLLREYEHWTVKQNATNWTEEYLIMLINLSTTSYTYQYINWFFFGSEFKQWKSWSKESIAYCLHQVSFERLVRNASFPWIDYPEMLKALAHYDKTWIGWNYLSQNPGLQLTEELINLHKDKWYWGHLSRNPNLSPQLINKYEGLWNWEEIFKNKAVLTPEIVASHPAQWSVLWYVNISESVPFGNYKNFVYLLNIPVDEPIEQHISKEELLELLLLFPKKTGSQ